MINRISDRRRAAAAVEFAIAMTVLIPIFVLGLDLARAYRQYLIITDCARSGALWLSDPVAAAQSPYATYQAAALANSYSDTSGDSLLSPALTAGNISSATSTDANGNSYYSVTVQYSYTMLTGMSGRKSPSR